LNEIVTVAPDSPTASKVSPGDSLVAIGGQPIGDVLDYQFYSYDENPLLTLQTAPGEWKMVRVEKEAGADLGLSFSTYLMDQPRACGNRCVFCFIDQLPRGMRPSLYFKDDDVRLSFLTGNYVSLTNVTEAELERMIRLGISPINISVHATEPGVRRWMLGNPTAGSCLSVMQTLKEAGITMHAQIVLCPGVNDGAVLQQTMADLAGLYPALGSVSVVPVGLTKHRGGCYPLSPFTEEGAEAVMRQVGDFADTCLAQFGTRLFFLADEFYLLAKYNLPVEAAYEGYPQLENGVGLLRSFHTEFVRAMSGFQPPISPPEPFSIATGVAAAPFLQVLLATASQKCGMIEGRVHAIRNDFFGHSITVAGLVVGRDLLDQLRGVDLGARLLIPQSMLRHGEGVFLDDMTVEALSEALGVPVVPVAVDGGAFFRAISSS